MSVPATVIRDAYAAHFQTEGAANSATTTAAGEIESSGFVTKGRFATLQIGQRLPFDEPATGGLVALHLSAITRRALLAAMSPRSQPLALNIGIAEESLSALSLWNVDEVNKRTCETLIDIIEKVATNSRWGSLEKRLRALLDQAIPEEGYAPLQPASLSTLLELVLKAPNARRPAISVDLGGRLWAEWVLGERQRFALELLGGAELRFAWVKPDERNVRTFASRYGKVSVTDFLSEEGAHSSAWRRIAAPA